MPEKLALYLHSTLPRIEVVECGTVCSMSVNDTSPMIPNNVIFAALEDQSIKEICSSLLEQKEQ
jgi:hypothetical protein